MVRARSPASLPESTRGLLTRAAEEWFASPARPTPAPEVVSHWDCLIAEWVADAQLPLLVRKSGDRGVEHKLQSGRAVVCVDNSPAHWTFACAIAGERPSKGALLAALESGEWPVMFAATKAEMGRLPRYRGLLAQSCRARTLNDSRWKICHVLEVGLGVRGAVESLPPDRLVESCRLLLSPSNMFVVPNSHGGFGELPEVIEVFARARRAEDGAFG